MKGVIFIHEWFDDEDGEYCVVRVRNNPHIIYHINNNNFFCMPEELLWICEQELRGDNILPGNEFVLSSSDDDIQENERFYTIPPEFELLYDKRSIQLGD